MFLCLFCVKSWENKRNYLQKSEKLFSAYFAVIRTAILRKNIIYIKCLIVSFDIIKF